MPSLLLADLIPLIWILLIATGAALSHAIDTDADGAQIHRFYGIRLGEDDTAIRSPFKLNQS